MQSQPIDWKGGIMLGAAAGVILGWFALAVNAVSGVFVFENGFANNLISFSVGGAIFGIVVSGLLSLLKERLPFRNIFLKAVFVATVLWATLEIGAIALSSIEPDRYHFVTVQSLQGLFLAVVMGGLLGLLWRIKNKES